MVGVININTLIDIDTDMREVDIGIFVKSLTHLLGFSKFLY